MEFWDHYSYIVSLVLLTAFYAPLLPLGTLICIINIVLYRVQYYAYLTSKTKFFLVFLS